MRLVTFACRAAIFAVVVGAVGVVWQVIDPPGQTSPSDDIAGAKEGKIAHLAVVDGDYDRWYVAHITKIRTTGDRSLLVTYITGICDRDGLVGYKILDDGILRLTIVAGQTGDNCIDPGVSHRVHVPLPSPLAGREVIPLQPSYTGVR